MRELGLGALDARAPTLIDLARIVSGAVEVEDSLSTVVCVHNSHVQLSIVLFYIMTGRGERGTVVID